MIYLNLHIRNPRSSRFENVYNRSVPLTKHKYWAVEILKTDNWFRFELQYTIRQDHAGISVELGMLGWEFHCGIRDSRHWNYTDNCWEVYTERTK
jgi:hypothetical protein